MAAFNEASDMDRVDFQLLQEGWIALVHRDAVLNEIVADLQALRYRIDAIDCRGMAKSDFIECIGDVLEFPSYYGKNLDALNDCLRDLLFPEGAGRAIVLRGFDHLAHSDHGLCTSLLDIFDVNARGHMLFGRQMIVLAQSDNPRFEIGLPARRVGWNWRSGAPSSRGL